MGIPLVGLPAPAPKVLDLLTTDFGTGLPPWTNSGGTLTVDATRTIPGINTNSAKFAVTASGQYIEATIPGTFLAGVDYYAVVGVSVDASAGYVPTLDLYLGLIGTDSTHAVFNIADASSPKPGHGVNDFVFAQIKWKPSANRTGVKIRLDNQSGAHSFNIWLGVAKVVRARGRNEAVVMNQGKNIILPLSVTETRTVVGIGSANTYHGLSVMSNGGAEINSYYQSPLSGSSGLGCYATGDLYGFCEHAPGDHTGEGYNFDVGDDYVGFYYAELDASHAQLYPYDDQFMQLYDRGTAGWSNRKASDPSSFDGKISDSFQWPFYISGAQTTGTNKGVYFQTPEKAIIDEVRIHLGTAPTGASFIVDVNDDGVTIFTSQANRPTIAISATDATSGVPDGGTAVAKNSVLTIDVDQIGSTIAGSDLVVFVRGRLRW